MIEHSTQRILRPTIVPLGDGAALVRFSKQLDDLGNRAALSLAGALAHAPIAGVEEVVASLVSVLVRYDADVIGFSRLSGEIALRLRAEGETLEARQHDIGVRFGGEDGPDLEIVAQTVGLSVEDFIAAHNAKPLRVLTTGFAPGFVYCGFHTGDMVVKRRPEVRPRVPVGSVLFAAGQTAITATEVPTGWNVIGRTQFRNFQPEQEPPTVLGAGDMIVFKSL